MIRTPARCCRTKRHLTVHQRIACGPKTKKTPDCMLSDKMRIPGTATKGNAYSSPNIICCFFINHLDFQCENLNVYVTLLSTLQYCQAAFNIFKYNEGTSHKCVKFHIEIPNGC